MHSSRSLPLLTAASIVFALRGDAAGKSDAFGMLPTTVGDLDSYRWKNRLVLLFAPSADDPAYVEQSASLHAATYGLVERDIVVLRDTEPQGDGALRRKLSVEGFEVLLVGKDGGMKLRKQTPIDAEELFTFVDSMPMRRRENSN